MISQGEALPADAGLPLVGRSSSNRNPPNRHYRSRRTQHSTAIEGTRGGDDFSHARFTSVF